MNAAGRTRLDQLPEWHALAKHREEFGETHLRGLFAKDVRRAERLGLQVGDLHLDFSKHLVTDDTLRLLGELAAATGVARLRDAMFDGERINVTEDRAVLHTALRAPVSAAVDDRRRERRAQGARGARQDGALRVQGARRPLDGSYGQADQERSSTSGSAAPTSVRRWRTRLLRPYTKRDMDVPLRLQRRRRGPPRGGPRSRPGRDAVRRRLEDLHHDRDHHQRHGGPQVAAGRTRRRRGRGGQALRGGVHERGEGRGVRHRHGEHVRVLGLGRRALLLRLGHRPHPHGRRRRRTTSTRCSPASISSTSTSAARPSRPTRRC